MLLYHCNGNDVDTVIVDGRTLMAGRQVVTVDEEEVLAKAEVVADRIWKKAEAEIGLPPLLLEQVKQV
jgi:hypothetical protein